MQIGDSDNDFGLNYNKEKYKNMLLNAAETVLRIFGFGRPLYSKPKDKKWWILLRRNAMNEFNGQDFELIAD